MRWHWIGICICVGFFAGMVVGIQRIRTLPHTYSEAVMQVLDARQIAYEQVLVEEYCPPSPQCLGISTAFSPSTARVTVSGPRPAQGWIVCLYSSDGGSGKQCTLSLNELQLRNVPVPPLLQDIPWLVLLQRYWRVLQQWWKY